MTPDWIKKIEYAESRNQGLGGTDISAIVGINPYKTAFDVWLEKTGKLTPNATNEFMKWGLILEPILAKEYADSTGQALIKPAGIYKHPERSWHLGSVDYLWKNDAIGLDCKTTAEWNKKGWGEPGTDQIPETYLLQCQWYMSLTGAIRWDVPVLIGGNKFAIYTVKHNPSLADFLLNKADDFWTKYIVGDSKPDIQDSETANDWIKKIYSRPLVPLRKATDQEESIAFELTGIKKQMDALDEREKFLKISLKESIAFSEGIELSFGKISWRKNKDGEFIDWEALAKSFNPKQEQINAFTKQKEGARVFRLTEKKEK